MIKKIFWMTDVIQERCERIYGNLASGLWVPLGSKYGNLVARSLFNDAANNTDLGNDSE